MRISLPFPPAKTAQRLSGALLLEGKTRITSYNVCYTKLLRAVSVAGTDHNAIESSPVYWDAVNAYLMSDRHR